MWNSWEIIFFSWNFKNVLKILIFQEKSCDVAAPPFSLLKFCRFVLVTSLLYVRAPVARCADYSFLIYSIMQNVFFDYSYLVTSVTYLERIQLLLLILKLMQCWNDFTCTQVHSCMQRRKLHSRTLNGLGGFESSTKGGFWNFICKTYIWTNLKVFRFIFWRNTKIYRRKQLC